MSRTRSSMLPKGYIALNAVRRWLSVNQYDAQTYRSEILWRNTNDFLDDLFVPFELGHELLIGECGHIAVRPIYWQQRVIRKACSSDKREWCLPAVHGNFMSCFISTLDQFRISQDLTTNHKESDLFVCLVEMIIELRTEFGWTVIEGHGPLTVWTSVEVIWTQTLCECPNAVRVAFNICMFLRSCSCLISVNHALFSIEQGDLLPSGPSLRTGAFVILTFLIRSSHSAFGEGTTCGSG